MENIPKRIRKCYQCFKEIPDKEGKYYCSEECWRTWQKQNYDDRTTIKKSITIKQIQERLLGMRSNRLNINGKPEDKSFENAKEVFESPFE